MGNLRAYVFYCFALIVDVCFYVFKDLIKIFLLCLHAFLSSAFGFWIEIQWIGFVEFSVDMRSLDISIENLYWSKFFYLFILIWKLDVWNRNTISSFHRVLELLFRICDITQRLHKYFEIADVVVSNARYAIDLVFRYQTNLVVRNELVGILVPFNSFDVFEGYRIFDLLIFHRTGFRVVSQLRFWDSNHGLIEGADRILLVECFLFLLLCDLKVRKELLANVVDIVYNLV